MSSTEANTGGHPIFAAVYDVLNRTGEGTFLHEHRQYLAQDLHGRVLDLGAGTGAMLPYFDQAAPQEVAIELHGIEPDPHMRRRAERKAENEGVDIEIEPGRAERLPYLDETFDRVVASVVFCTISDVDKALSEVHRVLKIDGEFRFLEHVRSDGRLGRVQDSLAPFWKRVSAGCRLNRRTRQAIVESPLEMVEIDTVEGIFPTKRIIRGTAARRY